LIGELSSLIVKNIVYAFTLFLHFAFQAENDAIGQELQKQLEAAGVSNCLLISEP